jgi:hypothetical protein
MKRGLVLVEGQTEERFINECLGPYLLDRGLTLQPTIVKTKRVVGGPHFKGGVGSFNQVQRDLGHLLHDTNASVITTLFDYYALPAEFPGMTARAVGSAKARVEQVEAAWASSVCDPRFVPHLVLHELEAWVFADPGRLAAGMFDDEATIVPAIAAIAKAHASPEDIDEGPQTAPSKRLLRAFAAYQKTVHGPLAIAAIGIERARATCPHFAQWLDRLAAIAGS